MQNPQNMYMTPPASSVYSGSVGSINDKKKDVYKGTAHRPYILPPIALQKSSPSETAIQLFVPMVDSGGNSRESGKAILHSFIMTALRVHGIHDSPMLDLHWATKDAGHVTGWTFKLLDRRYYLAFVNYTTNRNPPDPPLRCTWEPKPIALETNPTLTFIALVCSDDSVWNTLRIEQEHYYISIAGQPIAPGRIEDCMREMFGANHWHRMVHAQPLTNPNGNGELGFHLAFWRERLDEIRDRVDWWASENWRRRVYVRSPQYPQGLTYTRLHALELTLIDLAQVVGWEMSSWNGPIQWVSSPAASSHRSSSSRSPVPGSTARSGSHRSRVSSATPQAPPGFLQARASESPYPTNFPPVPSAQASRNPSVQPHLATQSRLPSQNPYERNSHSGLASSPGTATSSSSHSTGMSNIVPRVYPQPRPQPYAPSAASTPSLRLPSEAPTPVAAPAQNVMPPRAQPVPNRPPVMTAEEAFPGTILYEQLQMYRNAGGPSTQAPQSQSGASPAPSLNLSDFLNLGNSPTPERELILPSIEAEDPNEYNWLNMPPIAQNDWGGRGLSTFSFGLNSQGSNVGSPRVKQESVERALSSISDIHLSPQYGIKEESVKREISSIPMYPSQPPPPQAGIKKESVERSLSSIPRYSPHTTPQPGIKQESVERELSSIPVVPPQQLYSHPSNPAYGRPQQVPQSALPGTPPYRASQPPQPPRSIAPRQAAPPPTMGPQHPPSLHGAHYTPTAPPPILPRPAPAPYNPSNSQHGPSPLSQHNVQNAPPPPTPSQQPGTTIYAPTQQRPYSHLAPAAPPPPSSTRLPSGGPQPPYAPYSQPPGPPQPRR